LVCKTGAKHSIKGRHDPLEISKHGYLGVDDVRVKDEVLALEGPQLLKDGLQRFVTQKALRVLRAILPNVEAECFEAEIYFLVDVLAVGVVDGGLKTDPLFKVLKHKIEGDL